MSKETLTDVCAWLNTTGITMASTVSFLHATHHDGRHQVRAVGGVRDVRLSNRHACYMQRWSTRVYRTTYTTQTFIHSGPDCIHIRFKQVSEKAMLRLSRLTLYVGQWLHGSCTTDDKQQIHHAWPMAKDKPMMFDFKLASSCKAADRRQTHNV